MALRDVVRGHSGDGVQLDMMNFEGFYNLNDWMSL